MQALSKIIPIIALAFLFSTCKKEAGEGGTSTINGKVYAKYYNQKTLVFLGESYAPDERVYIIYGNSSSVGNDVRTAPDGSYSFPYLHKGDYTIYAYSDCDTCLSASGVVEVKVNVTISKNRKTVDAPTIYINRKRQ